MLRRLLLPLLIFSIVLFSCWQYRNDFSQSEIGNQKVFGYKPVYGEESPAKKILYTANPTKVTSTGNIYAFRNYIFQVDPGYGIHVIDNSMPADVKRIGFITALGCSQISIKDNKLYTNSYDDLVVLDFSDLNNVHEVSRTKAVFTEYRTNSPLARPPGSGYFECPDAGKFVVGWIKDTVLKACFN